MTLPPGQRAIASFPRFGLPRFANRFPGKPEVVRFELSNDGRVVGEVGPDRWGALPRTIQLSDLHCVTTWSSLGHRWEGGGFRDFCTAFALDQADQDRLVVFRGSDGYHAALPLVDLLQPEVLLADRLDGAPLPVAHGAPLRLVAPAHYGYKNVKHIERIEFGVHPGRYRPAGPDFIMHPRARVAVEERGVGFPGWLLRRAYRPLIAPTIKRCAEALEMYQAKNHSPATSEHMTRPGEGLP